MPRWLLPLLLLTATACRGMVLGKEDEPAEVVPADTDLVEVLDTETPATSPTPRDTELDDTGWDPLDGDPAGGDSDAPDDDTSSTAPLGSGTGQVDTASGRADSAGTPHTSDTQTDPADTDRDPIDTDPADTDPDPGDTDPDPVDTDSVDTDPAPGDTHRSDPGDTERDDPGDTDRGPPDTDRDPGDTDRDPGDTDPVDTHRDDPGDTQRDDPADTHQDTADTQRGDPVDTQRDDPGDTDRGPADTDREPLDTGDTEVDTADTHHDDTADSDTPRDTDTPVPVDTADSDTPRDTDTPVPVDTADSDRPEPIDTADTDADHTAAPDTAPADTAVPVEICNGIDDDGDGHIDEDALDGQWWYPDVDGDGFGDPWARTWACEAPTGHTDDDTDCDDSDPLTNPLSPDVINGVDDDCDGSIDEPDVAFVAAWQCISTSGRASQTDIEVQYVQDFLADLDLGVVRIDGAPSGSVPSTTDLSDFSLVLYTKCGWRWEGFNQGDVHALEDAADGGAALFLFGDDMAYQMASVVGAEPLVMLHATTDNGTSAHNSPMVFDTTAVHAAYAGPYGTPVDYAYAWDMDRATASVPNARVLATHGAFGTPVFLAWEAPASNRRQATLLTSVYNANHGSPGSLARVNAEIVFKNTVTWLLRLQSRLPPAP